jgi:transmembrane sensor
MTKKRTSGLPLPVCETLESGVDQAREDRLWANVRARRGWGGHSEPPKPGFYLPAPLGNALTTNDVSADRSRIWREIDARRRRSKSETRRPVYAFSFGMAALAMALLTLWTTQRPAGPEVIASPLLQSSGAPVPALEAEAGGQVVQLSDRSEIRLEEGARIEPLTSSGTRFELLLAHGSAEFSVTPGGPRRWVIEAGLATVEVIGTVFRVSRTEDSVDVAVSRGIVLVRSEALAGRVQRVLAGQTVHLTPKTIATVEQAGPTAAVQVSPAISVEAAPVKVDDNPAQEQGVSVSDGEALAPVRVVRAHKQTTDRWRVHLQDGAYADAYQELGRSGLARAVSSADSMERLLELADVARLSGHPAEAVPALERALKVHASNPQAALAAFTLGRVLLDQLHKPSEAAVAFERAIVMRPPHALLADCHARLVEAHARSGDVGAAERAATRYRTIFPAGRHTTDLDRWTSE